MGAIRLVAVPRSLRRLIRLLCAGCRDLGRLYTFSRPVPWVKEEPAPRAGRKHMTEATAKPSVKALVFDVFGSSDERRVGNECVRTCRSRWSSYNYKKNTNVYYKTYRA